MSTEFSRAVENLRPSRKYVFRVRGINAFGQPSDWSDALVYETPGDSSTPAAPSDLVLNFDSPDLVIRWSPPVYNSDGTMLIDLSHYLVTISTPTGNSAVFETNDPRFFFSFDENVESFSTPQPRLTVSVRAVDVTGKKSAAVSGQAQNAPPPTPTEGPDLTAAFTIINVSMDRSFINDFKGVRLYHSTNGTSYSVIPTPSGVSSYSHSVQSSSTHYYRYSLIDVFGQESGQSPATSTTTLSVGDAVADVDPPSIPTGLTIAAQGFVNNTSWVEFDWSASTDNVDVAYYELQYKRTASSSFSSTLVGGDHTSIQVSSLVPQAEHHVRIRAVDSYGNKSDYSPLVEFTTSVDTTAPDIPVGLTTIPGIGVIGLTWRPNSEIDFNLYELYASTNPDFVAGSGNLVYSGDGSGFLFAGADPDDTWYFKLRAVDDYGNTSGYSPEVSGSSTHTYVNDTEPPNKPTGVSVTSSLTVEGRSEILVQWTQNSEGDLAGYELGHKEDGTTYWTTTSIPAGAGSHLLANLQPATTYNIRLAAFDTNLNKSDFHNESETTPTDTEAPDVPGNPAQITVLRTIIFKWDPVDAFDLAGYRAQIATDPAFSNVVHTWRGLATSIEWSGASATTYHMRVEAYDRSGNYSNPTTPISTTTALIPDASDEAPPTPTGLAASEYPESVNQAEKRFIVATWNTVTHPGLAGYKLRIRRGLEANYQYQDIPAGMTAATFSGLNPDDVYRLAIKAYDQFGNQSEYSNEIIVATETDQDPPENVQGLAVTPSLQSATLKWEPVGDADLSHYNVHVSPTLGFTPTVANKFAETASTSIMVNKYHNGSAWVDMQSDTVYYFKVNAVDRAGNASLEYASSSQTPYRVINDTDIANAIDQANNYTDAATAGLVTTYYLAEEPTDPNPGDLWIDIDTGKLYRRNESNTWDEIQDEDIAQAIADAATAQSTADGKIDSYYQSSEPTVGSEGDLWFDTSNNNEPHRHNGSTWITVRDTTISIAQATANQAIADAGDAQATADGKVTTFYQATEPTADGIGDLWIDTDDDRLYRWDSEDWVEIQDADIAQAIADAATAQSTADSKIVTFYQTSEPTGQAIGDLWVDTDNGNRLHRWDGDSWTDVHDVAIDNAQSVASQALTDAATAQSTADGAVNDASLAQDAADQAASDAAAAQASADGKITTFIAGTEPTAEAVGDLWIRTSDNRLHRWSGSNWIALQDTDIGEALTDASNAQATADGKIVSFYQDDEPEGSAVGDLWIDTNDDNELYRWNGSVWISVRDTTIAAAQAAADAAADAAAQALEDAASAADLADGKIDIFYGTSAPTGMDVGDYWLDSGNGNIWKRYDGATWQTVQDSAIQQALTDASNAQDTADGKNTIYYQPNQPSLVGNTVGDTWVDTDGNNRMYEWTGTIWSARRFGAAAISATARQLGSNTTFYNSTQPASPLEGDFWVDTGNGNLLKRYTNGSWVQVQDEAIQDAISAAGDAQATADGKVRTFAQDDQPGDMAAGDIGDIWIDTNNDNLLHRWSGTAWVELRDQYIEEAAHQAYLDALAEANTYTDTIAEGMVTTYYQANQPTGGIEGDLWIDIDTDRLYRYNGSTWDEIQDAGIAQAIADAADAQSTADGKIESYFQDAQPTGGSFGDLWFDTNDENHPHRHNGSTWVSVRDATIAAAQTAADNAAAAAAQAISDAADAHDIADGKIDIFYGSTTPTGMAVGDYWLDSGSGNVWKRYNGTTWATVQDTAIQTALTNASNAQTTANSKTTIFYQDAQPPTTGRTVGDTWIETDEGNRMYRWTGSIWQLRQFSASAIAATARQLGSNTTFYQGSAPAGVIEGDFWVDTNNGNLLKRYTSGAWIEVQDDAIQDAISAAGDAQATADGKVRTFAQDAPPGDMVAGDIGDLWIDTDNDNLLHRWSGDGWVEIRDGYIDSAAQAAQAAAVAAAKAYTDGTVDGLITTFYQAGQPSGASLGDLWIDSDTDRLYRYDGTNWDEIRDADIAQAIADAADAQSTADGKIQSFYGAEQPEGGAIGDLWFDTDDNNKPYRWSGSTWMSIQDATIAAAQAAADAAASAASQALSDAADAQDLADAKIDIFYGNTTPTGMALGDYWLDSGNGNVWKRYNGTTWQTVQDTAIQTALTNASNAQTTANSKTTIFYQDAQPSTTGRTVGDTWIETDEGNRMYRWTGSVWQLRQFNAAAIAATARELGSISTFYQGTTPTGAIAGDFWVDTANGNLLKRYSGSVWAEVQDQAIQDAISAAGDAQATADGKVRTFAQDAIPTDMVAGDIGDIWIDTNNNNLMHRWSGTAWVELRDGYIDTAAQAAQAAAITAANNYADNITQGLVTTYYEATQPTGASEGDLWIDIDTGRLYRYNGSIWNEIVDSAIVDAIAAAEDAQSTADGKIRSFYQDDPPGMTPGEDTGDFWIDTNDNNKLHRWSGSAWQVVGDQQAPNVPAGLALTQGQDFNGQVESIYINATWTASTATDLAGYKVRYRRGSETAYSYQDVTTNSVKLSGLHGGVTYAVQVAAYDKSGNISGYSGEVTRTTTRDAGAPPAPTAPTGTANVRTITWAWTETSRPDDFAYFEAQVDNVNTFASVDYTFKGPSNTFAWTAPSYNTTYYMRVRAADVSGNISGWSTPVASATTGFEPMGGDSTAPGVPVGLALTTGQEFVGQVANIYVNATWTARTETDLAGYSIRFFKTGETRYEYVNVPKGNTSAKITGVSPGTGYSAQIAAYDRSGNYSAYSTAATVTSGVDTQPPPPPTSLVTTPFIKSTNVGWTAPTGPTAADLSHYNVHVGTTPGFTPSRPNKFVETSATSITVNKYYNGVAWVDMVPGTPYHFKITSEDRSGNVSAVLSSGVSGQSPDPVPGAVKPATPTGLLLQESGDVIDVSFSTVVAPVDSYEVWGSYDVDNEYSIISDIDAVDVSGGTVLVKDQNMTSQGTAYYRIYAVNDGLKSNPLTGQYTVSRTVSETGLDLNVDPTTSSFILTYDVPDDRLLEYVSIKYEARATAAGFSEANAVEIYRGLADTYIHEIKSNELEYYHQFWLSAVTRT